MIGYVISKAIHLITAAYLVAEKRKSPKVEVKDMTRAYSLFIDVMGSTDYMLEYQQQFLYNDATVNAQEGVGDATVGGGFQWLA